MSKIFISFLLFAGTILAVMALPDTNSTSATNPSAAASTLTLSQMADKLISKLKSHMTTMALQSPKSRGYDYSYGFLDK